MKARTLELALRGGMIKRFHTEDMLHQESVAEHSYGVAHIAYYLTEGVMSGRLCRMCLCHDVSEIATGDIPAPVKWRHPILGSALEAVEEDFNSEFGFIHSLNDDEKVVLKWADSLQLMWFCIRERKRGNRNSENPFYKVAAFLKEYTWHERGHVLLASYLAEMEKLNECKR